MFTRAPCKREVRSTSTPAAQAPPIRQFIIAQVSDGNYTIVGSQSGLAVEVPNSSLTAGTTLDQWTPNGGKNQEWQFIHPRSAPGTYTITNQNSGLLMEVSGNSTATGAAID